MYPGKILILFLALAFCAKLGAEAVSWQVQGAPYRAFVRLKTTPKVADSGILIELPEFGQTRADMGDVVLVDEKGEPQPLAKIWRGEGQRLLLLAKEMAQGKIYAVYFGGPSALESQGWTPKTSLLMEVRRLPEGAKFDSWPNMQNAWTAATETDGAGFFPWIYEGENPFGAGVNFVTHYSGWIDTTGMVDVVLYTLSSDASFVLVNGKFEFDWPGVHSPWATPKTVRSKEVPCSPDFTKIDYYHAKGNTPAQAGMVLGWQKDGKFETIPTSAWLHPGESEVQKIEEIHGLPLPRIKAEPLTYLGYGEQWFFETKFSAAESLPEGWTAEWQFQDGAIFSGSSCQRVIAGSSPQHVTLTLKHESTEIRGVNRLGFTDAIHGASVNDAGDIARYLSLLNQETPSRLSKETLGADLLLLRDFGSDGEMAGFAEAWLQKNPDPHDPLWFSAQSARLRTLAQTDAAKALGELKQIDPQFRKYFAQQFDLLELDLLVFYMRDANAEETAKRIAFLYPNTETERLAKIRIGDLYRLTEHYKQAVEQYQSIQKTIVDESAGRKLPAQDQAYSITIKNLIVKNLRNEAMEKLHEWELRHPMAKFDSDFLLLRGRALNAFGRWNEELAELDSFKKIQDDSPYLIDADFYRACALKNLGKKEEAKKIWIGIAKDYPKHELAEEAKRRANAE